MSEAIRIQNMTPSGARVRLAEALPLRTPYLIQMFPSYGCNFRCEYCIHALARDKREFISDKVSMDYELYKKCINDMKAFDSTIKMLRFAAIGEPLIHPQIAEMVGYARDAKVAQSIDIVTNGALLTKKLSDDLIRNGLSKLRVSLNGLSADDFKKYSSADVDFETYVENIRYFYRRSRGTGTKVYIKIIDYMVKGTEREALFFNLFDSLCDEIAIEHLTPTIKDIDYDAISQGMRLDKGKNEERLIESGICPQPFYMMQINPDGKVVPCCSMKYPAILGDVTEENVCDIWNGREYNHFRTLLLQDKEMVRVCRDCNLYLYDMHEEDRLDDYVEKLLRIYQEKQSKEE